MAFLSRDFVFGIGHEDRPVPLFLFFYLAGWIGFAAALWQVARGRDIPIAYIIVIACACRAAFLPSNPILENDGYRYILDGAVTAAGGNPYQYPPEIMADRGPHGFWQDLQDRSDARTVLSRVTYQEIPTIYPPLAQFSFAIGQLIMPWSYVGQRIVFIAFDLAAIAFIMMTLRELARPVAWVVMYAWNPLILKEIANSAHSDAAAACCLAAFVWALVRLHKTNDTNFVFVCGMAFAGAVLARLYPVMLTPIAVVAVYRLAGFRGGLWFLATVVAACVIAYLPFLTVPTARLTEGLQVYGEYWRRNEALFAILGQVFPQPRLVAAAILVACVLAATFWAARGREVTTRTIIAMQGVLLCWLLVTPAVFPWYAAGIIALAAVQPNLWVIAMSGSYGLYYLLFHYSAHGFAPHWSVGTRAIEHGVIVLALCVQLLARTPAFAVATASTDAATTAAATSAAGSAAIAAKHKR